MKKLEELIRKGLETYSLQPRSLGNVPSAELRYIDLATRSACVVGLMFVGLFPEKIAEAEARFHETGEIPGFCASPYSQLFDVLLHDPVVKAEHVLIRDTIENLEMKYESDLLDLEAILATL